MESKKSPSEVLTDLKLVAAAAQKKWDENSRFRAFLKSKKFEDIADTIEAEGKRVASQVDCTQCANCCKSLTVSPHPKDVKRLSDGLQITALEFRDKYLKKDLEGDLVFKQKPCPFLKNNKCSVYEHRPETCRSYPHLEKAHMVGRGWYILENTLVCPIVYNTYESLKQIFSFSTSTKFEADE